MKNENAGVIAWFVNNPVAANLLMMFILIVGFLSFRTMEKELLPTVKTNVIYVSAVYPSASPKEVEEGITLKIEEAIKNINEVKKVQSYSSIGVSNVMLELDYNADIDNALNEVKNAVDTISTFPQDIENITVRKTKPIRLAFQIQLYGNLEEGQAKSMAEQIRRELLAETIVRKVDILGTRKYEISIEIDKEQLQKYKLTLRQVAQKIKMESVNLPSGGIKTEKGNLLIRVEGQSYRQQDFENIALLTTENGSVVKVRDIAKVNDGYIDQNQKGYLDGKYSVGIAISAVADQDLIQVAESAKAYLKKKQASLPQDVYLTSWLDATYYLENRMTTMRSNLFFGAILVFVVLLLFMNFKMAFWVMLGLPVSFAGASILMAFGFDDISLNMVSMFGFIMVVGILVDDGIVVAESIDSEIRRNGLNNKSVIKGTQRIALPAVFGVLTTIIAFFPMMFIEGPKHSYLFAIGFVVCACLLFSLIESKWILPSHIAATNGRFLSLLNVKWQENLQQYMNRRLEQWVAMRYAPVITKAIDYRYITMSFFVAILIITLGLVSGGIVKYELFPAEPNDFVVASFNMAQGVSDEDAIKAQEKIEKALYAVETEYQKEFVTDTTLIKHLFNYTSGVGGGSFVLELTKAEDRGINSFEIVERWQKKVGHIDGAATLDFSGAQSAGSRDLSFMLVGGNKVELEAASVELHDYLRTIEGLSSIATTLQKNRQEYIIDLTPLATSMNLTLGDVALQVKEAFYGAEAQKILREEEEISVMVRYPKNRRSSLIDLEEMPIRLPDGRFMQLKELANIDLVYAESNIVRINGEYSVHIRAKVDRNIRNPRDIYNDVTKQYIPTLIKQYPTVNTKRDGLFLEEKETEKEIQNYFLIALLSVFILLAIPLKSYLQPIIIMTAIPFGVVGAIWGHSLLNYSISFMSLFGIVALTGVVVNDSLLLVDFVNRAVKEDGLNYKDAAIQSGVLRFRAIMLTTVTTFFGVIPIILESSVQAANMIPMAISLGFGILFATLITLILVPCLYVILEDIKRLFSNKDGEMLVES
jgi:multidrug efflux pump subunit AcrB